MDIKNNYEYSNAAMSHRHTIGDLRQALRLGWEIVWLGHVYQIIQPNGMRNTLNGISQRLFKKIKSEVQNEKNKS